MDKTKLNESMIDFENDITSKDTDWFNEYLHFSQFVQSCFISKNSYIIDTGNFQNANLEMIYRIKDKIERHPLLWKLLFMIG